MSIMAWPLFFQYNDFLKRSFINNVIVWDLKFRFPILPNPEAASTSTGVFNLPHRGWCCTYSTYNALLFFLYVDIWLVVSTPLKNISQLGVLFPIYGGKKCSKPPTKYKSARPCMCLVAIKLCLLLITVFVPIFVLNGEEVRVGWVSKKITPRPTQTLWSIHICGPICRCVYTHIYIYIYQKHI